jgi:hypothetical protein
MASEELGHGLYKWGNYIGASVQGPDEIALPQLDEYLAMDAEGYILTHQLSALEWARAMGRPLSAATLARGPELLAKITQEHAANTHFSDLWTEQAAFLTVFGDPIPATIEKWAAFIVEHHLENGDWGNSGAVMTFDGHSTIYDHSREHVRGLAMIVLAHYLALTSSEG